MVPSSPDSRGAGARLASGLALSLAVLLATVLLDRALGLAGLPSEPPAYPVAPPFFEATVENLEYTYTRATNDRGIRYRQVPLGKPAGTYRVVLVGDSFTEGACVEAEERWSDRVEQARAARGGPPVELINCGEAGTHPVDYARTLVQLGLDYEPDAVVVGIYFDDVPNTPADLDPAPLLADERPPLPGLLRAVHALWPHALALASARRARPAEARRERPERERRLDLVEIAHHTARQRGIDEATFERWRRAVPDELLAAVAAGKLSPGLLTHVLTRPDFFYEGIGVETEAARARMRALQRLLDALAGLCRERGARFGVVLMPSVHQFDPASAERPMARLYAALDHPVREEWKRETTGLQRELAGWAERAGVPLLDLVPVFRRAIAQTGEPLNYAIDPHWTPAGHAVAAEAIEAWMEACGLLPP